jgi:hypothetical protein
MGDAFKPELDAAGLRSIIGHGISDRELERAFEGVDTGHILLVIVPQIYREILKNEGPCGELKSGAERLKDVRLNVGDGAQRPRVFYKRELETQPLIIAMPQPVRRN